ncbi:MAG: hypothetical protein Q9M40_12515 [Sulfurimonas sp.]|nr:hypothetical protein [Sulfurimonas sp.]
MYTAVLTVMFGSSITISYYIHFCILMLSLERTLLVKMFYEESLWKVAS